MKKAILVVLSALLIISFAAAIGKAPDPNPKTAYTVTAPYDYPVLPGTAEWAKLQTLEEKIQACAVEESLMRSMTTQALLETVVRYPLLANIYAFDRIEDGLASVGAYFPGLDLLMQRADLDTCIQQALESRPDSVLEEGYLHILQNYQPAP